MRIGDADADTGAGSGDRESSRAVCKGPSPSTRRTRRRVIRLEPFSPSKNEYQR